MAPSAFAIFIFVGVCSLARAKHHSQSYNQGYSERAYAFGKCLGVSKAGNENLIYRESGSLSYMRINSQWNLRIGTIYPLAYFLPNSARDVANAVKCGLKAGVRIIPNSGGHSYESIGWGNNRTIVVDFRNMTKIQMEGSGQNAVGIIEPGALVGNINAYFWQMGGYATPMGNCLTVGIGGQAIGGGVGYFASLYGLTMDSLLEVEIVDGRGRIVRANKFHHRELFWALRGSGPGYIGIVTRVKLKLFQASTNSYSLAMLYFSVKDFAKVYHAFQEMLNWIKQNEPGIFLGLTIGSDTYNAKLPPLRPGIIVSGFHIQDPILHPQSNASFLAAMSRIFPAPKLMTRLFPNYIQFVALTGYAPVGPPTTTRSMGQEFEHFITKRQAMIPGLPPDPLIIARFASFKKGNEIPRYFKAKSLFVKREFSLSQLGQLGDVIAKIPRNNFWILINSEEGAIQSLSPTATAYVHRDSLLDFTIMYEGSPAEADVNEGMSYLQELWEAMQFMDSGETYQNYHDLDVIDHLDRNYKGNLWRLEREKRRQDPFNYFVSPLSLPG